MFRNPATDLIVVLVVVLLIFGPKRLPTLGRGLGHGMREFKEGITGKSNPDEEESQRPALTAAPSTEVAAPAAAVPSNVVAPAAAAPASVAAPAVAPGNVAAPVAADVAAAPAVAPAADSAEVGSAERRA